MRNEDINKNEILNEEVFSEKELSELNEVLKKSEDISLPESLSKESIKELLEKEVHKLEVLEKENEKMKKENKSLFKKMIAIAAVFAIIVTTVVVAKPWEYMGLKQENSQEGAIGQNAEADDYTEIEKLFVDYQKNYQKAMTRPLFGAGEGFVLEDDAIAENGAVADSSQNVSGSLKGEGTTIRGESATTPSAESEHGETNEQVKGVNEADIIKNDGKNLYVVPNQKNYWEYQNFLRYKNSDTQPVTGVAGNDSIYISPGYNPEAEQYKNMTEEDFVNKIFIVKAGDSGALEKLAEIKVGKHENEKIQFSEVREIFVDNNRLIAILDCYSDYGEKQEENKKYYYTSKVITCAVSYDISNKSEPCEEWRVYQDGDYLSARKTGNKLILISNYNVPLYFEDTDIRNYCIPEVYFGETACKIPSSNICVMGEVKSASYSVVSVLDVTNHEKTFNSTAVLGGGEQVYCTQNNLYIASGRWEETVSSSVGNAAEIFMIDESLLYYTEILKFDISGEKIQYETKGKVNGNTLNQFSIDEYNGYLRVATTVGNFKEAKNNVYILDEDMVIVGMLEGIAKGETIKAVRFMGDTGYVVTFEQTDPLFVIDLQNPESPVVLGELKIPGFSNYLHPVTENYLLGIGVNGDENGAKNGMKVSLFDVSDKKNPKEVAKFEVSPQQNTENLWGYLDCPAFSSHKAVCWDSKNLTMYIPYSVTTEYMHMDDNSYRAEFHSSYNVIALQVDVKNSQLKKLNNYLAGTGDVGFNGENISRVTYIGETVYSYAQSENKICSFDKTTAEKLDSIVLE